MTFQMHVCCCMVNDFRKDEINVENSQMITQKTQNTLSNCSLPQKTFC